MISNPSHQKIRRCISPKDINLEIKEKEVICIIGPSGSGKSTILRCLNYLEEPSGGDIVIDNIKLEKGTNLNAIRKKSVWCSSASTFFQT